MALITNNISGSAADSSRIGITGSVIVSNSAVFPSFPGTDVVFFVSGSSGGTNKSSFGGDLIVSGAMSIGGDSLEVTGTIAATLGLSGSLTKLVDGTSYLIAGSNVTITSASNGAITVAAAGTSPGGAIKEIQYNGGGVFTGSINFSFDGGGVILTGSLSQGRYSTALGESSHAEGYQTTTGAGGSYAHAEGQETSANGGWSHAEGYGTTTNSSHSHAEGYNTTAGGQASHAEGLLSTTSGAYSHAEGYNTTASGNSAHAEGRNSVASGAGSHSEGTGTTSSGGYSHVEGKDSKSIADFSHAEGEMTYGGAPAYLSSDAGNTTPGLIVLNSSYGDLTSIFVAGNYITLSDIGYSNIYAHKVFKISSSSFNSPSTELTLVDNTVSTPSASIGAQGIGDPTVLSTADLFVGNSSHAEGTNTVSDGLFSHAEGELNAASGYSSHAEGYGNQSLGSYSHAEGNTTFALGDYSHSEGNATIALGNYSHSEGQGTIASGSNQHAGGKYNVRGNDFSLFVVGNGTSDADVDRSDVLRINSGSIGNGRVEVTGSMAATMGLSGSLTTLVDGTSYLIAGTNITITSASNGSVTIDATGGGASSYYLNFLAGTLSSTAASASMESVGMDYYNIAKVPLGATSYTFKAILATTAGTTAYMDLYDYDGIVTGIPGPISGSVLTGSNQSYTYLTADLTPSLSAVTGSGIFEARIWCDPTGVSLNAICKNATLEIA